MFSSQDIEGQIFIRDSTGKVVESSVFLQNIKNKYFNEDFNLELISSVLKFDCFLDCIFIETNNYFLIEKYFIDNSNYLPYPSNLYYNLFSKNNSIIDYWYEDKGDKVLICSIKKQTNNFLLVIYQYSLNTGQTIKLLEENLSLSNFPDDWDWNLINIKSAKITYNTNTKMYNISFLIKTTDKWGLISSFLYQDPDLKIKESKGVFLT